MKHSLVLIGISVTMIALGCSNHSGEPERSDEPGTPSEFGEFKGDVDARWDDGGRTMELLADFGYLAPDGIEWDAPAKSQVDGASIPQVFWSLIGGPFEGKYRNASVVHDVACQRKDRPWKDVHRMFYLACRCAGVSEFEGKLLYSAVYHFGPRWGGDEEPDTQLTSTEDFERMQLLIAAEPTVETSGIERLTAATLRQRVPNLPTRAPIDELALPRLRQAMEKEGGPGIERSAERGGLEVLAGGTADGQRVERGLVQLRATAAAGAAADAERLRAQIGQERDPNRRAVLATQLVTLGRERVALSEVPVRVRVQDNRAPGLQPPAHGIHIVNAQGSLGLLRGNSSGCPASPPAPVLSDRSLSIGLERTNLEERIASVRVFRNGVRGPLELVKENTNHPLPGDRLVLKIIGMGPCNVHYEISER